MEVKKKIVFLSNTTWYLYNFRSSLIRELHNKRNFQVFLISPYDQNVSEFKKLGINVINWELNRSSLNPLSGLKSIIALTRIYNKIKPDIVHHFTIKAVIYGSIAAKLIGVNLIINTFTGLGQIYFMRQKRQFILNKIIPLIYRRILSIKNSKIIVQNPADKCELEKISKKSLENIYLIPGSGVDINFFKRKYPKKNFSKKPKILYPARLIKEKGFQELIDACYELWNNDYIFELLIAGYLDKGNNSCISKLEFKKIALDKNIICLGHTSNMKELYESVDLVVLPSWREGLSKSLIEAGSMECPIITTDVPGCKDIVDNEKNGLLVPVRQTKELRKAIEKFLLNPEMAISFGVNARKKIMLNFEVSIINKMNISLYK